MVVHGESPIEPVCAGTNRAAILAGADVLAHPGIIEAADVELASQRGVVLEITSRYGHNIGNGHVVALARRYGARLVIDSDAHEPHDLLTPRRVELVGRGAGLSDQELRAAEQNARSLVSSRVRRGASPKVGN